MSETIATRIQQRLDALGLSARAASIQATGKDSTVRMILNGRSTEPRMGTLQKLAVVLQTTVEWLIDGTTRSPVSVARDSLMAAPSDVAFHDADPTSRLTNRTSKSIEIRGTAAGSIIQDVEGFVMESQTIGFVKRPPSLEMVIDAYAILVTGDSMYPMHPPGQVRIVNPVRPTAPGDSVVVQTRHWDDDPGQAYIKVLKRRTQKSFLVEQFNPPAILEIPTQFVVACHYVLTQNDILGY